MKYRGIYKITGFMAVVIMVLTTVIGPVFCTGRTIKAAEAAGVVEAAGVTKDVNAVEAVVVTKDVNSTEAVGTTGSTKAVNASAVTDIIDAAQLTGLKKSDIAANEAETVTSGPDIETPSAILMEAATGQVIYEKDSSKQIAPASITKIMTLILIFEALESGQIKMEDPVTVSEYAASMGGSQVFLEEGEIQSVRTMIKCIAVASANDACVAMSEYICGSEDVFVEKMNEKAKQLGMEQTHFVNCCGLDTDGHTSSARDVALMSRELINNHPEVKEFSNIWMEDITHVTRNGEKDFTLSNTNKLIKQYSYATGLKTGSTSKAGCCLSGTAMKDGIELIAVVMAAPTSKVRFKDAITLLNYGFSVCSIYQDTEAPDTEYADVNAGVKNEVKVAKSKDFSYMFLSKYDTSDIRRECVIDTVNAPVSEGDEIGVINYYYKDNLIGTVPLVAAESVELMDYKDSVWRVIKSGLFG